MKIEEEHRITIILVNEEIRNLLIALEILFGTSLCKLDTYKILMDKLEKVLVEEDVNLFREIGRNAIKKEESI